MRINKYIADSGIASRRNAEKLIAEGRVKINQKTVTDLATDVDISNDTVTVDGVKIQPVKNLTYIMLNKPKGCVATVSDEHGRKTVFDYIDLDNKRLFPVGRLDYDSEGLLIITNDGDLSFRLTHPSNEVPKTYIARIEGEISESELAVLRGGVVLDGVKTKRAKIKLLEFENNESRLQLTIYEGRNRQIRRMFETIGKEVVFLKRTAIGDLKLGGLSRGAWRYLSDAEINYLKNI